MPEFFPDNSFGPLMKGLVIGGLGIFHVFLAQFAIGGGVLMCYLQWRAMRRGSETARRFLHGFFKFLVLVSFVLGAVTGVAMWFTSIQVGPRTIGMMVDAFHWVWAIEWTFFSLEVVAGYSFYRYGDQLNDRTRLTLLLMYTVAAWASLFWINGILSWQLTPGAWIESHTVWVGFFNPGFWPSLFYRTVASITIAALVGLVVVNLLPDMARTERERLVREISVLLLPIIVMPLLGAWYLSTMPADSRSWALGGSPTIMMFLVISIAASLFIGMYCLLGLVLEKLYINAASALLLVGLAFGASAGGEFVREGVRKPFTIRETLYSNEIAINEVAPIREQGITLVPGLYPLRDASSYPTAQLQHGAIVYRQLCSACHTLDGTNAVDELTRTWTVQQKRLNLAQLQRTKPFMPPFAGSAEDVEALVQMFEWRNKGLLSSWPEPADDPAHEAVLATIRQYLNEVGTAPADPQTRATAWQHPTLVPAADVAAGDAR